MNESPCVTEGETEENTIGGEIQIKRGLGRIRFVYYFLSCLSSHPKTQDHGSGGQCKLGERD